MAIKTKDEIMATLRERIGDDASDDTLAFLEDVSDTLTSLSDADEWRKKYEENDAEWRAKYRDRFFGSNEREEREEERGEEETEKLTFEKLFKEE